MRLSIMLFTKYENSYNFVIFQHKVIFIWNSGMKDGVQSFQDFKAFKLEYLAIQLSI